MAPKLKIVTCNPINYKPVGSNAFPLIKKFGKCTNLHNILKMMGWSKTVSHQEWSQLPFYLRVSRLCRCISRWLPATLMNVRLIIKTKLLWNSGTGHFCALNLKPALGLSLASFTEVEDWVNATEDCRSTCARDLLMWLWRQALLGGMESLMLWRKANREAKPSHHCLEVDSKWYAELQAILPTHLDTALFRMSWASKYFMYF